MSRFIHPRCALCLCGLLLLAHEGLAQTSNSTRPNILIIMADDLGYGDVGCYGAPIKTPYIDQLAKEGLLFTDFYTAAPNCSPARAGLLTGRTPSRVGIYDYIAPDLPMHLPDAEVTIAEMLKSLGYATCHVGKWHLSCWKRAEDAPLQSPTPADQGFDYWFASDNNAVPSHYNPLNFIRNGHPVGALEGYACQLVADEGINWLKNRENKEQPFFLNVWFNEPHRKIASPPELIRVYDGVDEKDALYYANVSNLDKAIGRILTALETLDLREETLVLFTSDNGPWRDNSSGPLRAKKSSLYEGGIRVPGIVRWPGHVEAGIATDVPAGTIDMFPTIAAITETKLPDNKVVDGTNLLPFLEGRDFTRSKPLFWFFYKSTPMCVVRDGDYIITANPVKSYRSKSHPFDQSDFDYLKSARMERFELYDIRNDIGQKNDLAAVMPEKLESLKGTLLQIHIDMIQEGPSWEGLPSDLVRRR